MVDRIEGIHDVPASQRSTAELTRDLGDKLVKLVRTELRLGMHELQRKGKRAGKGAAMLSVASVLGLLGGATLVAAAVLLLALAVAPWLSAVIVGAGLLVLAGIAGLIGRTKLRDSTPPLPEEAIDGAERDIDSVKEAAKR